MYEKLEIDFAGRRLSLETGRLAKQAHGSCARHYGDTVVLATGLATRRGPTSIFFHSPWITGRRHRRRKNPRRIFQARRTPIQKGNPHLPSDRSPDAPAFPQGLRPRDQIIVTVLSADRENDSDVLSMIAASAALVISDIPHKGRSRQ